MFVRANFTHEVKFYYNISEMKLQELLGIILEREITHRLITRQMKHFIYDFQRLPVIHRTAVIISNYYKFTFNIIRSLRVV